MYEALIARVRYHIQKANFMGLKDAESTLLLAETADAIEELQRICDAMKPKYETVCVKCKYYHEANFDDKGFLICPACGMDITAWDFCSYFEKAEEGET